MISSLLSSILVCPNCGHYLIDEERSLVCRNCFSGYAVKDGIPRFVQSDRYVDSFSYEWARHSRSLLDSASGLNRAEQMLFERTGLEPGDLEGKLVLDAGCGMGRFLEIVKKYGGHAVGVDLSYSVDQARANVPGVDLVQADIMNLPFKDGSFDIVFSIGVIHHTVDTHTAFDHLARLVRPGGKLAVWVYSDDGWKMHIYNAVAACYRTVTTRMSRDLLYKLSHVAIPLYYIHRIPVIGLFSRLVLSTSCEPIPEWRVLDTFDWYSPTYQYKHTYREVDSWFEAKQFTNITNLPVAVSVQGTKKCV